MFPAPAGMRLASTDRRTIDCAERPEAATASAGAGPPRQTRWQWVVRSDFEYQGHGAVVGEIHCHLGPEGAGRHGCTEAP